MKTSGMTRSLIVSFLISSSLVSGLYAQARLGHGTQPNRSTEVHRKTLTEKRREMVARKAKLRGVLDSVKRSPGAPQAVSSKGKYRRDEPRVSKTGDEFVQFLSAPQYGHFEVSRGKGHGSKEVSEMFLEDNRELLMEKHVDLGFKYLRQLGHGGSRYVRFQQTFGGLEVIGAQAVVQVDESTGGVTALNNNLMRRLKILTGKSDALVPTVTAKQAQGVAEQWMQSKYPRLTFKASSPELKIFDPSIFQKVGEPQLVWYMEVWEPKDRSVGEVVIVGASQGGVVFHYSLINYALSCEIYDQEDRVTYNNISGPVPADTSPKDVWLIYNYLQDTYNYFNQARFAWTDKNRTTHPSWKSWNGTDGQISVEVRTNVNGGTSEWKGNGLIKCIPGAVADDGLAHEFTHGIVDATCDLTYSGESGAIDEAIADIFGEFVDQFNGHENNDNGDLFDGESSPWFLYEGDIDEDGHEFKSNHVVDMENPHDSEQPDTYFDDDFWWTQANSSQFIDDELHTNCGVGHKLAFLLGSSGDHEHNGITVTGLGTDKASQLFFEALFILTESATYFSWGDALLSVAGGLNFSDDDYNQVYAACQAVGIRPPDGWDTEPATGVMYVDASTATPGLGYSWDSPYKDLRRALAIVNANPEWYSDIKVAAGVYELDGSAVLPGGVTITGGITDDGSENTVGSGSETTVQLQSNLSYGSIFINDEDSDYSEYCVLKHINIVGRSDEEDSEKGDIGIKVSSHIDLGSIHEL